MDQQGINYVIECKHWLYKSIGRPVVQKLHSAAITYSRPSKGAVYTTGFFSKQAIEYAQRIGIQLVDLDTLATTALKKNILLITGNEQNKNYLPEYVEIPTALEIGKNVFKEFFSTIISFPQIFSDYFNVDSNLNGNKVNLKPFYLVTYDLQQIWETKTKSMVIHHINRQNEPILIDGNDDKILNPLETKNTLKNVNITDFKIVSPSNDTRVTINQFNSTMTMTEIAMMMYDYIIGINTQTIQYVGLNHSIYTKECIPNRKNIRICNIKKIYLPLIAFKANLAIDENQKVVYSYYGEYGQIIAPNKNYATIGISERNFICSQCKRYFESIKKISVCNVCNKVLCKDCVVEKQKLKIKLELLCQDHIQKNKLITKNLT
jgi:restriction system protein